MEKNNNSEHSVLIEGRKKLSVSGVLDVPEFSQDRIALKTTMGGLSIKGKNLLISRLNTDDGTLDVNGEINIVQYTRGGKDGFIAGLFG